MEYNPAVQADELHAEPAGRSPGWRSFAAGGLLIAAVFVAYLPAIHAGYIWDDELWLTDNPLVVAPDGWPRIWFTRQFPQYYPLVLTTFRLERLHLWKTEPAGYHLVNIALHAAAVVLVWRILRRLCLPGAWFAAAVFALHPVHVESVAWITERKNVLSAVFYLLVISSYLRFDAGRDRDAWLGRRAGWYFAALGLFVCALLSKTVTCSLPVVLLLLRWWQRRLGWRDVVLVLPMVAIGVLAGLNTACMEVNRVRAYGEAFAIPLAGRLIIAANALLFYLGKLLAPINLTFIYPRWEIDPGQVTSYATVAAVAVAAVVVGISAFRWRGPAAGLAFFVITLFPALGFFNVAPLRFSFVADHFQYLASLGVIALAVGVTARLFRPAPRVAAAIGVAALVALGTMTYAQCKVYENRQTLWEDVVRKNSTGWMPRLNLGAVYFRQERYEEALREFQYVLDLDRTTSEARALAHTNIGMTLLKQDRPQAALQHLQQAVEISPYFAKGYYNLATALAHTGRLNEAVPYYQKAVEIEPDYAQARCDLGGVLIMLERYEEALVSCRQAEKIRPDYPLAYYNQVLALMNLGDVDAAMTKYRQGAAVQLLPQPCLDFAESLIGLGFYQEGMDVLRNGVQRQPHALELVDALAWQYATCPPKPLRRGRRALELARQVCQATDHSSPQYVDTLAAAHAELGEFTEAATLAQRAVELAKDSGQADYAAAIQARVRLYVLGKPYRGPR